MEAHWINQQGDALILDSHVALLDGLVEEGRRAGRWLWRCHIDLSTPFRPVWEFLEPSVDRYDAAIFTADAFVQRGVVRPRVACIAPSIDPRSAKNADLNADAVRAMIAYRRRVSRLHALESLGRRLRSWLP